MKNGLYETIEILSADDDGAKNMIRHNLANSPIWVGRALMALLARQTTDEQEAHTTRYHNARGFNATDAEILTSFGKQCQRYFLVPDGGRRFDSPLSPKQLTIALRKLSKYAGQLLLVAREKAGQPVAA